jgi:hypothetical protein
MQSFQQILGLRVAFGEEFDRLTKATRSELHDWAYQRQEKGLTPTFPVEFYIGENHVTVEYEWCVDGDDEGDASHWEARVIMSMATAARAAEVVGLLTLLSEFRDPDDLIVTLEEQGFVRYGVYVAYERSGSVQEGWYHGIYDDGDIETGCSSVSVKDWSEAKLTADRLTCLQNVRSAVVRRAPISNARIRW